MSRRVNKLAIPLDFKNKLENIFSSTISGTTNDRPNSPYVMPNTEDSIIGTLSPIPTAPAPSFVPVPPPLTLNNSNSNSNSNSNKGLQLDDLKTILSSLTNIPKVNDMSNDHLNLIETKLQLIDTKLYDLLNMLIKEHIDRSKNDRNELNINDSVTTKKHSVQLEIQPIVKSNNDTTQLIINPVISSTNPMQLDIHPNIMNSSPNMEQISATSKQTFNRPLSSQNIYEQDVNNHPFTVQEIHNHLHIHLGNETNIDDQDLKKLYNSEHYKELTKHFDNPLFSNRIRRFKLR